MDFVVENILFVIIIVTIVTFIVYAFRTQKKNNSSFHDNMSIDVKLRAYERMILFLDRIEPVGMINRLEINNLSADEVSAILIKNIVHEYEYNVSQQIYMSNALWSMIELSKNKIINSISLFQSSLSKNASANDLVEEILNNPKIYYLPLAKSKQILKQEAIKFL